MAKKYVFGWTSKDALDRCGTAKALCLQYAGGYGTANDTSIWIPRSICIVEEANEYGNCRIYIPEWFFRSKGCSYDRIRDIDWGENGVDAHIEM